MSGPGRANTDRHVYEYAVLRAVPRPERDEAVNVGVLLYCRGLDFLRGADGVDPDRLHALDPAVDVDAVRALVAVATEICAVATPPRADRRTHGALAASGPGVGEDLGRRFRRLTAPRSTVVRPGPVHTGLTVDPAAELDRLLRVLVLPVADLDPDPEPDAGRPRLIENTDDGPELVVWGDAEREHLGRRLITHRATVAARGLRMLRLFVKDGFRPEAFFLDAVSVYARRTADDGEFSLRFRYATAEDPEEFGYAYFDVFFHLDGPAAEPYWPFRFTVGFH